MPPPLTLSLDGDDWTVFDASTPAAVFAARVPGVIHLDLMAAGKLQDPFYRDNERAAQWVGQRDWTYRRTFDLPADFLARDSLVLVCEGLDTVAELSFNGQPLGTAENMFHAHRFDLRPHARQGTNELAITFRSAERISTERQAKHGLIPATEDDRRVWLRKAQCHFGWDWGPRLLTCGIWRPIRIEARSVARLESVFARTLYADADVAVLQVDLVLDHLARQHGAAVRGQNLEARITLAHGSSAFETESRVPLPTRATAKIEIPRPHLWWPLGYGEPELYDLRVTLLQGDAVLDTFEQKIGLRTVKLVQQCDDPSERPLADAGQRIGVPRSFTIAVNGTKIFCRGANWIPADALLPRVTPERYAALVDHAADAGMNMLRVWGGGIYEDTAFYAACDARGILVWQDFMFACAYYPEPATHGWFARLIDAEARAAITRLRNHACLALWCGNNENHQAHHDAWFRHKQRGGRGITWGGPLYHELLPAIVAQLDPSRPYWPGSPFSSSSGNPHYALEGDVHRWDVWSQYGPVENFRTDQARFMSEFGFQALPTPDTLRECTEPQDRRFSSPVIIHHNKQPDGPARLRHYAAQVLALPPDDDLDAWSYVTQVVQARAVQLGVDHWRSRRFGPDRRQIPFGYDCSGCLFWQLNDCWPVASWSSLDHGRGGVARQKALHYYARRFFAPVRAILVPRALGSLAPITLHAAILNDTRDTHAGRLTITQHDLTGEARFRYTDEIEIAPNTALHLPAEVTGGESHAHTFWHMQFETDRLYTETFHFADPDRILPLPAPVLTPEVHPPTEARDPYNAYVLIRTDAVVRDLAVFLPPELSDRVTIHDNFVTLAPGKSAMLPLTTDLPLDTLSGAFRLRHAAAFRTL